METRQHWPLFNEQTREKRKNKRLVSFLYCVNHKQFKHYDIMLSYVVYSQKPIAFIYANNMYSYHQTLSDMVYGFTCAFG